MAAAFLNIYATGSQAVGPCHFGLTKRHVGMAMAAPSATLGAEEEAYATGLQNLERLHARKALVKLLGQETATKAMQQKPEVLYASASEVKGSWKALRELLGKEAAAQAVQQNPEVLTALAVTVKGSWDALERLLGQRMVARAAQQNMSSLCWSAAALKMSGEALMGLLGKETATDVICQKTAVLIAPLAAVKDSWMFLVDELGEERATTAVRQTPALLEQPAASLNGSWKFLVDSLGVDAAINALQQQPALLLAPAETVEQSLKALLELLGDEAAKMVVKQNPEMLRAPRVTIGSWKNLVDLLGKESATRVVQWSPEVLVAPTAMVKATWKASVMLHGEEEAAKAVLRNPSMLCWSVATLKGSGKILKQFLDEFAVATERPNRSEQHNTTLQQLEPVQQNKSEQQNTTLQQLASMAKDASVQPDKSYTWDVLVDLLGSGIAAEAVEQNPAVLRWPPAVVKGSWMVLVDLLGARAAATAVEQNPAVLRAPAALVKGCWMALGELLDEDTTSQMMQPKTGRWPMAGVGGRAGVILKRKLFASPVAVPLAAYVYYVTWARPVSIQACWNALVRHFGEDAAMVQVQESTAILSEDVMERARMFTNLPDAYTFRSAPLLRRHPRDFHWGAGSKRLTVFTDSIDVVTMCSNIRALIRWGYASPTTSSNWISIHRNLMKLDSLGWRPRQDNASFVEWTPREYNNRADHYAKSAFQFKGSWDHVGDIPNSHIKICCDGAYRTGHGAAGYAIFHVDSEAGDAIDIGSGGMYLASCTSAFQAETIALDRALADFVSAVDMDDAMK